MIKRESFYANRKELHDLNIANSKEADSVEMPLDVDWDFYRKAEEAGMMFSFISRKDGKINGYINCSIQYHHHRKNTAYCSVDVVYVKPNSRNGILGLKLLKKAEEQAKIMAGSVVMTFGGQKVDISPLAKRLGYEQSEIIYRKVL